MATETRYLGKDGKVYWLPRQMAEWEATFEIFEAPLEAPTAKPHEGEANPAYAEAKAYASTYSGTFQFMLDMKARVNGPKKGYGASTRLTDGMVAAILRCKANDERKVERPEPKQTGRNLMDLPNGRTRACVENESGSLTFLLIDVIKDPKSKWNGWAFVKQQTGPDETRIGSQRPGQTYVGQWAVLIDKVLADPMAAVVRYGNELGHCGVCGLPLTNEESREAGIGPVCRAKIKGV